MATHPLQVLIEDSGFDTMSYSGRGMYGKTCLAVDIDEGLGQFISRVMVQALENSDTVEYMTAAQAFAGLRTDGLGMGIVVYFPSVPYTADEDDGSDEDDEPEDEAWA